jgi:predicted flavoprotein YhiN
LVREWLHPLPADSDALAGVLKKIPVPLGPPRPIDEAISTAGGIRCVAFDRDLMLHALPGIFVAGEMLDWDAPTGGYLLTACLATGRRAGRAAAGWARR